VPVMLVMLAVAPGEAGMSVGALVFAPLIYLVFGYIITVIGCAIYNLTFKFTGGIEYESNTERI
jgi:hypothetical protein